MRRDPPPTVPALAPTHEPPADRATRVDHAEETALAAWTSEAAVFGLASLRDQSQRAFGFGFVGSYVEKEWATMRNIHSS